MEDIIMVKEQLSQLQKEINREFELHGITDELLEKQVKLNQLRYKHDIVDEGEVIYDGYVQ